MKFKMIVKNDRGEWVEEYERDTEDANQCAQGIVDFFNNTLRPGELPRKLVSVEVIEEGNGTTHKWDKMIYGMSVEKMVKGTLQIVDLYRCQNCMITGYRLGLHPTIYRDYKYRAKKYDVCNWKEKETKK